jgi:hypothetical protein
LALFQASAWSACGICARRTGEAQRGVLCGRRGAKSIWEVPNGQHIAGITTEPEEYERRVLAFFDDALATLD